MAAEKNFEHKVTKFLDDNGVYWIKYWGGSKFTRKGVPDLLCFPRGRAMALELKSPTGKPTDIQLYQIGKMRESGCFACVLAPKDWDEFKEQFAQFLEVGALMYLGRMKDSHYYREYDAKIKEVGEIYEN